MGAYNLPKCLRITVGTKEDNARLLAAVKTFV
jgi:histidinol-phosphate/aromatic aminotransferase/cobyric acid decarboxylase-like protein